MIKHKLKEQTLYLLPEKALFWEEKKLLIIADLHLGKAGHFRKSGIPVSDLVHSKDILTLEKLIQRHKPEEVILLGDLFHSEHNQGWEIFKRWLKSKAPLQFKLVLGNHDVLEFSNYRMDNLEVIESLDIGPFNFTHIPEDHSLYNIAGHIHPAVRLRGKARQSVRIPCYYFGDQNGILPAFGNFTGTARINIGKTDSVFGIAENKVIKIN
ncbi:ligase-associated DNA damage response endonuclease PdeM [Roseivirga sp. E12]|uniref:ligase-associated DNA damage response endonuclease PdeM n=1 Tax=Roseivirga sp. E12 TaxID=2819237 RepID=UPI001ABCCCA1|nr:ligase-associated DNA damage response endonuclease PdeM [Roseivirga sp. E12]MBO3697758.1 ligase-associated DNA damage response endonuclease PdeM [Roseivirga sp. E12]